MYQVLHVSTLFVAATIASIANCFLTSPVPAHDQESRIGYQISLEPRDNRTVLNVTLSFVGDASGKTTLRIPSGNFGTPGISDSIQMGAVENASIESNTDEPKLISLVHEPDADVSLQYRIMTDPAADQGAYRPQTSSTNFHYFGSQWRVTIEGRNDEQSYRFEFTDVPDGWVVFSNLGSGSGPYDLKTQDALISGFIAGGEYARASIDVAGTPFDIYVAKSFEQSASIIDAAKTIVSKQGELFGGFDREFFVISMSPRESLRAGVAIDNAFVCFVDPETSETEIDLLIAHEAFHNWLPGKGTIDCWKNGTELDEFRFDWFVEGFTEFVARRMLLESGRLSKEQYVAKFNADLTEQAKNPMQHASLKVVEEALKDRRYTNRHERTSYFRGPLIALEVDYQLRQSGKTGVVQLVEEFLSTASQANGTLNEQQFFDLFQGQGIDLRAVYRRHIIYGEPVVPNEKALGTEFVFQDEQFTYFDHGFDDLFSRLQNEIRGVSVNGAAYRAGLRDGMIYESAKLANEPGQATQVSVREAMDPTGAIHRIEFEPELIEIVTRHFVRQEK